MHNKKPFVKDVSETHFVNAAGFLLETYGSPIQSINKFKETIYHITVSVATSGNPFNEDDLSNLKEMYEFFSLIEKNMAKDKDAEIL